MYVNRKKKREGAEFLSLFFSLLISAFSLFFFFHFFKRTLLLLLLVFLKEISSLFLSYTRSLSLSPALSKFVLSFP